MKKSYLLLLLFFLVIYFGACEKDDICVGGDTPLLVIRFYNADTITQLKKVSKFRIIGVGQNATVTGVSDRTDLDSIAIPLQVSKDQTGFYFIRNSSDLDTTNATGEKITIDGGDIDTLYFNYLRKNIFVSRACGYISHFDSLSSDLKLDTDNWIKKIEIDTSLIENSTAAHVKIFH